MIKALTRRLLEGISPDRQTLLLLRAGGRGVVTGCDGMLAAWRGWTTPLTRQRTAADIDQPSAFPRIDLDADDPVAAIVGAPEFAAASEFFAKIEQVERALVSANTQAILYTLVRNLRPEHVFEIGTYRASTSKALCRALEANRYGSMHTVDPLNSGTILRLIGRWPPALRERICYYPSSSMDFFNLAVFRGLSSHLIFVDGNHDYEYALFDIQSAARVLRPGGFIVIDNVSQAGPFYAAQDFIRAHPAWRECGHCLEVEPAATAFDRARSTVPGTDMCVLRAPKGHVVERRLTTTGQQPVGAAEIQGIELDIAGPASGMLNAQFVVRVLEPRMSEEATENCVELREAKGPTRVPLPWSFAADEIGLARTIELWLAWSGPSPLMLAAPPRLY